MAGGTRSRTSTTVTADKGRTTIPKDATVLLSDEEFGGEVIDRLKQEFTADKIVQKFAELLEAGTTTKHGAPVPDVRSQLATLEKVVHLTVGKPLDRQEKVERTVWTYDELQEMIAHSRELRLALRAMLAPFDDNDNAEL